MAVWIALAGTRLATAEKAFMAWFGPKGVATMTFALLVLGRRHPGRERIFNLAALAVFCSIFVHGLTDTPGADWIAERVGPGGESHAWSARLLLGARQRPGDLAAPLLAEDEAHLRRRRSPSG